jgi:hypothetical protein
MEKIWKTIEGFTSYEISNYGEIKTYNWKNKGYERIMKPALDSGGYFRTMLKRDTDGKFCTIKVHRLVCKAFIPNTENKPFVNHINGIRNDNRLINLEWCTPSENVKHSFKIGLSDNRGSKNPTSKLVESQVQEILDNYEYGRKNKTGTTKKQIAEKYNVSVGAVRDIVSRKTWKHLS